MSEHPPQPTTGWCWRADQDGDPAVWGIYGHLTEAEAIATVVAYEGDFKPHPVAAPEVTQDWRRNVPCRRHDCDCDGTHLELATGPGPGARPFTWVEAHIEEEPL